MNVPAMPKDKFLQFYVDTAMTYSKQMQCQIRDLMKKKELITYSSQYSITEYSDHPVYCSSKNDLPSIWNEAIKNTSALKIFELWEFIKLYKYSVPFFYNGDIGTILHDKFSNYFFDEKNFSVSEPYHIATSLSDAEPLIYEQDGSYFIKFVIQKSFFLNDDASTHRDYRYPFVIYCNPKFQILDLRYDSIKFYTSRAKLAATYEQNLFQCIDWIKENLQLQLLSCDGTRLIENVKSDTSGQVKIFKQMMELTSGGAAELTAPEQDQDCILPFIGEIRELIDENAELFNASQDIKDLLTQYLDDKEATAYYSYIYVKWIQAVASESYSVKVTFDYFKGKYMLLQHLTSACKNLGMERMNNAIKYFCESSSFVKGEAL